MSLQKFFNPSAVAVVGASQEKTKLGRQILDNLQAGGFSGQIYPLNLKEKKIAGLKAYAGLAELPNIKNRLTSEALLVIVVIPAPFVLGIVEQGAKLGIKNFIIISAGFKEAGKEGNDRENNLIALAHKYHLNILGPNCLGLINTSHKLNATFAAADKTRGRIALLSQSGAIGAAALDWLKIKDFNFAYFISLGNKAVLDENKIIDYLASDKNVDLIVAYLEEIKDGQKFMAQVSRLAKYKPVAVLKAGVSASGGQLALSHTGALAGSSVAVEIGIKRAGAIWLENLEELFNLMLLFRKESWHNPGGPELSIITNAGGVAVLAVDEISRQGVPFGKSFDLLGDADAARYELGLKKVLSDKKVNNVLVLLTPQTSTEPLKTALAIIKIAKDYPHKLIMTSFLGGEAVLSARDLLEKSNIPTFDYPEEAIRSFKKLLTYKKTLKNIKPYKILNNHAPKNLAGSGLYDYLKSLALLRAYKIPSVKTVKYSASAKYNYPVVLKAVGPDFLHKTDQGAVVIGLKNNSELLAAVRFLLKKNKKAFNNSQNYFVIQEQAEKFQELIFGFKRDVSFGPIIMIGLGGIYAEVFKEINLATADFDLKGASNLIKELKIFPILNGARGQSGYDLKDLAKALVSLAKLANEHPEIKELDINPMFIQKNEVKAGDVRIII